MATTIGGSPTFPSSRRVRSDEVHLQTALQINFPAWSPDGKSIAFIEGLMSDFGSVGGDIFLMLPRANAAKSHSGTQRLRKLAHLDKGWKNCRRRIRAGRILPYLA